MTKSKACKDFKTSWNAIKTEMKAQSEIFRAFLWGTNHKSWKYVMKNPKARYE